MRRWGLIVLCAVACGKDTKSMNKQPRSDVISQRLELWLGGIESGEVVYHDDGARLTSEVTIAGKLDHIEVSRSPRKITFGEGAKASTVDVPADGLPWGTGHVAFARLAQEWFPDAKARPIKLVLARTSVDAKLTVSATSVEIVPGAGAPLVIDLDAKRVGHATTGGGIAALEVKSTPDGIVAEPIALEHDGIVTRGVLWIPQDAPAKLPLLIIHAGSGPSDRDCNQKGAMFTNSFRLLAEALAKKQIATLRFDKRFSGQTSPAGRAWSLDDVTKLRIEDYVTDLAALVTFARKDKRFGPITVMGHSEGGLVSVLAAAKLGAEAPDALLFVNSLGRKYGVTIREQLASKVDATMIGQYDAMLEELRANKPVTIPAWLQPSGLVTPQTLEFFRSEFDLEPGALLGTLATPASVVQGETDVQTSLDDATALVGKRADVKLTRLPKTNHVLKEVAEKTTDMSSYQNPDLPLAPGVVDAIAAGIKR